MRFSRFIVAVAIAAHAAASPAASLSAIGPTYPIGEESALDMIMKKLREKERTGKLKQLKEEAVRRSMKSIENMPPVDGIVTATERVRRTIDPTVTYTKPVTTEDGRIVIAAGTRINPLEMTSLTKTLVFFDGRDPEQREAVYNLMRKGLGQVKPILVAGSWLDLTKAWKTQVYYDQHGSLSKRFGIRAVPSVIRQQDKVLAVDEIPAKELQ